MSFSRGPVARFVGRAALVVACAGLPAGAQYSVRTEGSGDINRSDGAANRNGAMVWNGQQWVVSPTWRHQYLVNADGSRLKEYLGPYRFAGTSPLGLLGTYGPYRVTRTVSSRAKRTADGRGTYRWEAVDYTILDTVTGKVVLLRSQGTGSGIGSRYADVYIHDDTTSGIPQTTTAFLGDPVWYTFQGMDPHDAVAVTGLDPFRAGDLPGAVTALGTPAADYFLDVNNGSDMGGKSYELICTSLASRVATRSASYVTRFRLRWMDSNGNLQMLQIDPALLSETYEPDPGNPVSLLVPVVLAVEGAQGSSYTTELSFTNRSTVDASLTLAYTATMGGGSGSATVPLPGGRQAVIADGVAYLRSLGLGIPEEGGRLGTLRVDVTGPPAGQVAVTARTTTRVPDGRAGLAYPALSEASLLIGPAVIHGLRGTAEDRSNLALVNAARSGDLRVRLTVTSGDPAAPGTGSFESDVLPAGGFRQYTLDELLTRSGLALSNPNVSVRVEPASGSGPFYAYAVVNDQRNSDGSFLAPTPEPALQGRAELLLPVVVETSSATPFTTELVVTNATSATRSLRLSYLTVHGSAPGAVVTDTLVLAPREQRIVPSFVDYLRSRQVSGIGPKGSTFAGTLTVTAAAGDLDGILVGARTTAPGSSGGRYGLFYPAVAIREAAPRAAWVFGLRQDAENRTNLALVNAGAAGEIRLRVELFSAGDGSRVAEIEGPETTLPPGGWTQLDRLLEVRAPGLTGGYARISRVSGDEPFLAYGVVNDGARPGERSGDGAYVPMIVE